MQKIWQKQSEFNKKFIRPDATAQEKQAYTKDLIIHLEHELHEVLDELNWKMHKHETHTVDSPRVKEEIIDAFKYLLNIAITWGMTPEEFEKIFFEKSQFVEYRYEMEQALERLKSSKRVCAVDIDGVLADYPASWVRYVEQHQNCAFGGMNPWEKKEQMEKIVSPVLLSQLKDEYRRSGMKRSLPLQENYAPQFIEELKRHGYDVVAISARPVKRYHNLFGDTLYWFEHHGMHVDALFFDDEKHVAITHYVPHLDFIVEDELGNAKKIAKSGYRVYYIDRYGKTDPAEVREISENIIVVKSLKEIVADLDTMGEKQYGTDRHQKA